MSILFSIVVVSIYIPTNRARGFPCLHTLSSVYCFRFLMMAILINVRWYFIVILISISLIFLGSKITARGVGSHEIKTLAPWKKSNEKPRKHIKKQRYHFIKKQRYHFANQSPYSQSYGFSSSHVWMVITFLPRSKLLLISWLQSPSAVILETKKIKSLTVSIVSPSICHEVMGPDAMILVFWKLNFKAAFSPSSHFHQEAL